MYLYKRTQAYSRTTGQPEGTITTRSHGVCDYCGAKKNWNMISSEELFIEVKQSDYSEASWYEHDKPHPDACLSLIFEPDYYYCTDYDKDGPSCSAQMVLEAAKADNPPFSLWEIMEFARLEVVKKLLAEGVTLDELGIREEE